MSSTMAATLQISSSVQAAVALLSELGADDPAWLRDWWSGDVRGFWPHRGWHEADRENAPNIVCCALLDGRPVGFSRAFEVAGCTFDDGRAGVCLSYCVHPSVAGRGVAALLAAFALLRAAETLDPDRICFMQARVENAASVAVGKRLGVRPQPDLSDVLIEWDDAAGRAATTRFCTMTARLGEVIERVKSDLPALMQRTADALGNIDLSTWTADRAPQSIELLEAAEEALMPPDDVPIDDVLIDDETPAMA